RVNMDPLHQGEVDHQAALGDRSACDVVPATAHRDLEAIRSSELERIDDVRCPAAPRDDRRPLVDEPVVDLPRLFIAVVSGDEQHPREHWAERTNSFFRTSQYLRHTTLPLA